VFVILAAAAGWLFLRPPATTGPPAVELAPPTTTPAPRTAPPVSAPTSTLTIPRARIPSPSIVSEDLETAKALSRRVEGGAPIGDPEVAAAEDLCSRLPEERRLRDLLTSVLLTAASQDQAEREYTRAEARLRRAAEVQPEDGVPRVALANLLLETSDWRGAEAAAREALALRPGDPEALEALGFALFRQDRNREASHAFEAALDVRESPVARGILERIRKGMADESGMRHQTLSHFHVRYDGEAHEGVGREILRVLERHYVKLTVRLDHQPEAPIPVILFSREDYYDASGAPSWSGGVYDNTDGRIRIPIGGLTTRLTPDMDGTLMHEVTHAFIADRTRGVCPRDVHEGLAQYMEGKRLATLGREQISALANGRIGGVGGFYMAALSFVEHLIANRGLGGINDLLRVMGETGSVDEAFSEVHGHDYAATKRAWTVRLRQRYGS
jgi:hypothetical protein